MNQCPLCLVQFLHEAMLAEHVFAVHRGQLPQACFLCRFCTSPTRLWCHLEVSGGLSHHLLSHALGLEEAA